MSDLMMTHLPMTRTARGGAGEHRFTLPLRLAFRAYATRHELADLGPRERADIGVSASAALAEAARLPWDHSPSSRRQPSGLAGALQSAIERRRARRLLARAQANPSAPNAAYD